MIKREMSQQDPEQIIKYVYDDAMNAYRVYIMNAEIDQATGLPKPVEPQKPIEVPVIVKELEIKEIEKPVIVKEVEIREVEKQVIVPVVETKIERIEVPVIVKEVEIKEVEKIVYEEGESKIVKVSEKQSVLPLIMSAIALIAALIGLIR